MTPSVSVVVPAHNAAPVIGETISSVLGQTLVDFELVVVDDCSADATVPAVREFTDPRIRLVTNDRPLGLAGNWNRAVAEARAPLVKLVCHDDLLYPDCLARQVDAIRSNPGVVMVSCRRDIIGPGGQLLLGRRGLSGLSGRVPGPVALKRAVRAGTNPFGEPVAVLLEAAALRRCGPFSSRLPYMIDLEMWCRVLGLGALFAIEDALCAFRVLPTALSGRLVSEQWRQTRQLLGELRRGNLHIVGRSDEVIGGLRAGVLCLGRRLAYRRVRGRPWSRSIPEMEAQYGATMSRVSGTEEQR